MFAAAAAPFRETNARAVARRRRGLDADAFVVLFAGKLVPFKRPLQLVRAVARLGTGATLLVAGSGPLETEMRAEAERLGVSIVMAGFMNQRELGEAYGIADCLALPSDGAETWGLVVNEALAAGLALCGERCGGLCAGSDSRRRNRLRRAARRCRGDGGGAGEGAAAHERRIRLGSRVPCGRGRVRLRRADRRCRARVPLGDRALAGSATRLERRAGTGRRLLRRHGQRRRPRTDDLRGARRAAAERHRRTRDRQRLGKFSDHATRRCGGRELVDRAILVFVETTEADAVRAIWQDGCRSIAGQPRPAARVAPGAADAHPAARLLRRAAQLSGAPRGCGFAAFP